MRDLCFLKVFFCISAMILLLGFSWKYDLNHKHEDEITQGLIENIHQAFKRGEKLTYRMHYGWMDAGIVELKLTEEALDFGGGKTFHAIGTGVTKGMVDVFFKVNDRYESYFEEGATAPRLFLRRVNEGGYIIRQDYTFNPSKNKVDCGSNKVMDLPGICQDMVSAFYCARNLNFDKAQPNDVFTIPSFVDGEVFYVKMRFIGRETFKSEVGKVKCLRFHPILQKGRIFKHEEDLNVWISDDVNHIPVSAQAKILVGSVKMDLTQYSGLVAPLASDRN